MKIVGGLDTEKGARYIAEKPFSPQQASYPRGSLCYVFSPPRRPKSWIDGQKLGGALAQEGVQSPLPEAEAKIPEPELIKISELDGGFSVFYFPGSGDYVDTYILLKSGQVEKVICNNSPSRPAVSPDKKRIAYVYPRGWEVLGDAFLYDVASASERVIVKASDIEFEHTPKEVAWLNDRYLLVIIGYAYGTASWGGDVYLYSTLTQKLSLFIKAGLLQQITDIFVNEKGVLLELYTFENIGDTEHAVENKLLNYQEVLQAATLGKSFTL